jgi:hypothetical protein
VQVHVACCILHIYKAGAVALSLSWVGVQLRIALMMSLVVLAFTAASFFVITILAFLFWSWYQGYDMGNDHGENR